METTFGMTNRCRRGAISVEYIILTALIAIALIVGWVYMQTNAEMNVKAGAAAFSRAGLVSCFYAARAAGVSDLAPEITVPNSLSGKTGSSKADSAAANTAFASKRVGGSRIMNYRPAANGGATGSNKDMINSGIDLSYGNRSTAPYNP